MKKIFFLIGTFVLFLNSLYAQKPLVKFNKYLFNITDYKATPQQYFTLRDGLVANTSGTVLYTVKNVEHIISTPWEDTVNQPPVHFIKKNGKWVFENFYENAKMHGARNYCFLDTLGTIAIAESDDRQKGNLWICKTVGDGLSWQKISTYTAEYSDIASGDFNGDGLPDVVTYGGISPNGWMQAFLQSKDGKFYADPTVIPVPPKAPSPNHPDVYNTGYAVGSEFLLGNVRPDIVKGQYSMRNVSRRDEKSGYGAVLFSYNPVTKCYDILKPVSGFGIFKDSSVGSTSIRFGDFNRDSKKDFAIATENDSGNAIQIFLNDGNNNFIPGQNIQANGDSLQFREFIVDDFNNDGWPDIFLQLFMNRKLTDVSVNWDLPNHFRSINIQKCIWMNNNGVLSPLKDSLNIPATPGFLVGRKIKGNLNIIGYFHDSLYIKYPTPFQIPPNQTTLIDVQVIFCNEKDKPVFNSSSYTFCEGDSLKLSIINFNNNDTLKWQYGSKSDITNSNSKYFSDETKLFVIRTDSLGCKTTSDTIQLTKKPKPNPPTLIRDKENFLSANSNKISWFLDGKLLPDTTQKIKPLQTGTYTAKAIENGCSSLLSAPYYYILTNLISLGNNEFIKITPNPFVSELDIYFSIMSLSKINMEIIETTTGKTVALKSSLSSGSRITTEGLLPGSYIIKITSQDQKLIGSFKVIKIH